MDKKVKETPEQVKTGKTTKNISVKLPTDYQNINNIKINNIKITNSQNPCHILLA